MVESSSPKGGVRKELLDDAGAAKKLNLSQNELYASTKAGCYFLASEFSRRQSKTNGVIHVAGNPGNYVSGVWDYVCALSYHVVFSFLILKPGLDQFTG